MDASAQIGRLRHLLSIAKSHIDPVIQFTLIGEINKAMEETGGSNDYPLARAVVTSMGWKRRKSGDRFIATIEFDGGKPPKWPLAVVWQHWPVLISVVEPEKAARYEAALAQAEGRS